MTHTRLFVGDLAPTVTEQDLQALFSAAGEVISVEIKSGSAFAFVQMASPEAAQKAITLFNRYPLQGLHLIVYGVPPRSHPKVAQV
ncbi:MAG TPA: RNA-binding protein [Aggregatilineales bacterium]|nr:RNA-binding protein [Aggregatilineales bacterium]